MGKLIVIEGLDGSGKATQTKLLCERLESEGVKLLKVSFPDYESDSSALVRMYLSGKFGDHPDDVNAYAASSFYAVDRYASFKANWKKQYDKGYVIIADRYATSNGIHQCSKLPEDQWVEYLNWLSDYEYVKLGIPAPDLVIYLDMSLNVSEKLLMNRYHGDETKKDIHEKDKEYLLRSRKARRFCAEHEGWKRIKCDDGRDPYDISYISERVIEAVKEVL